MRNQWLSYCVLLAGLCGSCRSASWVTHNDPLGFSVEAPAGWQVVGDRGSGRVTVSGPARQQAIAWPVFVPGAVDGRSAPAILRRLVAAAGIDAAWKPAPSPSANMVRIAGAAGDRTAVASFGWIGSPKGAAGFLYVTAAPTAAYSAEKETLSRILESFRATGAPAGAKASSGPDMNWARWQDPKENAFSLEVPAGWTVTGGAFRFAPVDIRKVVQASSPDGKIRVTGGDAELPAFTEPTQMLAMAGFREGSWYSPGYGVNMIVRRYTPGTQFAREYAATRAARDCANLIFTQSRDRPDVDAPLNQLMSGLQAAGGVMQIHSGEAAFTCEQNGQPASGYYFAGSLRTGAAGMPGAIWHVEFLYGYVAARGQAAQAEQVLSHMLTTYQENPQWMAMQQNVTAATSHIVTQTQQDVSKMISDTFAYKNQVDDEISRRRQNATLGTVDVIDADTGRPFKVENSSNYYWLDNHGVIAGTQTDTKPGWDFRQMAALP
jgi:hypothetical protein